MRPVEINIPGIGPTMARGQDPANLVTAIARGGTLGTKDRLTGAFNPNVSALPSAASSVRVPGGGGLLAMAQPALAIANLGLGACNLFLSWRMNNKLNSVLDNQTRLHAQIAEGFDVLRDVVVDGHEFLFKAMQGHQADTAGQLDAIHELQLRQEVRELLKRQISVAECSAELQEHPSKDRASRLTTMAMELTSHAQATRYSFAEPRSRFPLDVALIQGLVARADAELTLPRFHNSVDAESSVAMVERLRSQARGIAFEGLTEARQHGPWRDWEFEVPLALEYRALLHGIEGGLLGSDQDGLPALVQIYHDRTDWQRLRAIPVVRNSRQTDPLRLDNYEQVLEVRRLAQDQECPLPRSEDLAELLCLPVDAGLTSDAATVALTHYGPGFDSAFAGIEALAAPRLDPLGASMEAGVDMRGLLEPVEAELRQPGGWASAPHLPTVIRDARKSLDPADELLLRLECHVAIYSSTGEEPAKLDSLASAAGSSDPRLSSFGCYALTRLFMESGDLASCSVWLLKLLKRDPSLELVAESSALEPRTLEDRVLEALYACHDAYTAGDSGSPIQVWAAWRAARGQEQKHIAYFHEHHVKWIEGKRRQTDRKEMLKRRKQLGGLVGSSVSVNRMDQILQRAVGDD